MTIPRLGGTAPKWNRLHEQEMADVRSVVEALLGRPATTGELVPLWSVLSKWAGHRYKVCRNGAWQDEKRRLGGRNYAASKLLEVPAAAPVQEAKQEEGDGLPW